MIGHCWFERVSAAGVISETIRPWEDYGLYLVEYDDVPPRVRTYRATIEGRDGTLDLTEWEGAGIVRYNDRTVKIKMRDLAGKSKEFISKMLGGRFNIYFSDDLEHYYVGRCDSIEDQTRRHVSTFTMTFTCKPFRTAVRMTNVHYTLPVNPETYVNHKYITIDGGSVVPVVTASGVDRPNSVYHYYVQLYKENAPRVSCEFHDDGVIDTKGLVLTTGSNHIVILNNNESDDLEIDFKWHEEVI